MAGTLLVLLISTIRSGLAIAANRPRCDLAADVALASEDYPTAILLHQRLVRSEKNNAIAHYHLGFAYGMLRDVNKEIHEYRVAAKLGLKQWDLFLNLGIAYYAENRLKNATSAFEAAAALGAEHPEAHFNLALVYERAGRYEDALREVITSLALNPDDADAYNTAAIIYARMGDFAEARRILTRLLMVAPSYAPARVNLTILSRSCVEDVVACSQLHSPNLLLQQSLEE